MRVVYGYIFREWNGTAAWMTGPCPDTAEGWEPHTAEDIHKWSQIRLDIPDGLPREMLTPTILASPEVAPIHARILVVLEKYETSGMARLDRLWR